MYLSHIFISFSFSKKDKMEQFVSKAFIINGSLQFLYIRAFTIILLEIQCKKDVLMVVVVYMFLSSMYITYCYQLESKYQKDNNIMSNVFYYLNLIYFWDSACLFVGKLVSKTSFEGMLDIFFIGIGLILILAITSPKRRMTSANVVIENDIDVYNQIRLMIEAIEQRSTKRENLFDIFAYLSEKLQSQNLENDEIILKKKIDSFKNKSHINDKEFEYYLFQQVDILFRDALNFFRDSVILKVTYALFQIDKLGRYNKGYINLISVSQMKNLSFSQDFLVYRIKRRLEEKGIEDGVDKSNISFRYQCNQLISMISKISTIYSYFWNLLLTSSDLEDITKLSEYGVEINEMMDKIDDKFKSLQASDYNNKKTIKLYGIYIRDILNDQEKASLYLNSDQNESEISFQSKTLDLNSLTPSAEFQFMVISGKEENFGVISRISLGFCHILGYSDQELIGQNLDYLLPDCIHKAHLEMLKKKIVVSKIGESQQKNLKAHFALLKTSSKCLLPVNLEVGIILDEDYNPIIFSKINYDAEQFNFFSPGVYFFLTNHKLIIESFSSNSLDYLGLNNQVINGNNDITPFIKDFNEDVLTKLINSKYSEKLKVKLKILRQKYSKENVITWKNNKKYRMIAEEIIIESISCGFIFRIENSDMKDSTIFSSTQRFSIVGQIGGTKRNSITSLKEIEKRKDFPQIGRNFVPNNVDEINFDLNDKVFLFQNKTLKGEKIQSIGDYFNDRFFQPQFQQNDNLSNNSLNEESEEKESDEYDEEDEEEESEEKDNKIINKKSFINEDNDVMDYYKVKTGNIKFSVFNYNQNIAVEVKGFSKESKVEQVIKGEKEKSKPQNSKDNSSKSISFQVGTNLNKQDTEKKITLTERNNELIQKMVAPKIINKSILIFVVIYLIILVSILIISILFFMNLYSSRNNILKVHTVINYLSNIYRDILNTNFFVVEIILLLNEKYTNLYQDKDSYFEYCKNTILELYESSIKEIEYFCYSDIEISAKTRDYVENYTIIIKNYQTSTKGLTYTSLEMKITDALNEYDYSLFDFGNTNKSNLNPQNVNLYFVVFNVDNLIEGIEEVFDSYYNEIVYQIKEEKKIIYIYLIVLIFLEMIATYFGAKASLYLIMEKEKYLKYFFKIGDDPIRNILVRCEKFIKLNRETPTNMIAEPEINLESDNESIPSEASSLIQSEEEIKKKFKKKKKQFKKKTTMENFGDLKLNLFLTVLFYFLELILCIFITIYIIINLTKVPYFDAVEYLTIKYERIPVVILNNLRLFLLFYPVLLSDVELAARKDTVRSEIINSYYNISRTYNRLYGNISGYDLNKEIKDKYNYVEIHSLCNYIEAFFQNYSLNCSFFSSNITNQGLALVYSYLMNNVYYLFNAIEIKIYDIIEKNYTYNELYYGTEKYNNSGPEDENPFYLFNNVIFKNFTVTVVYLIRPIITDLRESVNAGIKKLFSNLKNNVVVVNIIVFVFLTLFYLCYITPFAIRKNLELNKTRKMLGIIPKDIFFNILNNEKMGEKEKPN
jgi:hypothetical protein